MAEQTSSEHKTDPQLTPNEVALLTKLMHFLSKRDEGLLNQLTTLNQNLTAQNS